MSSNFEIGRQPVIIDFDYSFLKKHFYDEMLVHLTYIETQSIL